jgi:hypothetical protein
MNRLDRYLAWALLCVLATAAVAWIAFGIQQEGIAPAILFPLFVGCALGAIGVGIRRVTHAPSARVAVVAALVWGLLAVIGQDYIGHRRRARVLEEKLAAQGPLGALAHSQVSELEPAFSEYLSGMIWREPIWWTLDLGLTVLGAVAVTAWGVRRFQEPQTS